MVCRCFVLKLLCPIIVVDHRCYPVGEWSSILQNSSKFGGLDGG